MIVRVAITPSDIDLGYDYGYVDGPIARASGRALRAALGFSLCCHDTQRWVQVSPTVLIDGLYQSRPILLDLPPEARRFAVAFHQAGPLPAPLEFDLDVPQAWIDDKRANERALAPPAGIGRESP